ncbi:hypothetical protein TIFTF001_022919 [Ficus carica]|uniref:Uncharacterized protein n=1 Tax=Ficus carica TaxID=3494 RepID=A0AA88AMP3_FICCA|nr:hypothetical protein TIFTF001_022919 [Ficus carica]
MLVKIPSAMLRFIENDNSVELAYGNLAVSTSHKMRTSSPYSPASVTTNSEAQQLPILFSL